MASTEIISNLSSIAHLKTAPRWTREDNSIQALQGRFQTGETLALGQQIKLLHTPGVSEGDKSNIFARTQDLQPAYWREWGVFRGSPAGVGKPNFEDVIKLMGVRESFVDFVMQDSSNRKVLAVDLMAGSAQMLPHLVKLGIDAYVGIDNNVSVLDITKRRLMSSPLKRSDFVIHDLSEGLPFKGIEGMVALNSPQEIRFLSMWGITYLDANRFLERVNDCLDPSFKRGTEPSLAFCMITDGSFDPAVLKEKFLKEIVPLEVKKISKGDISKARPLIRALRALPKMKEFGNTFRGVVPLWFKEEIEEILTNAGFEITAKDESLLWGQSTAIQVKRKVA